MTTHSTNTQLNKPIYLECVVVVGHESGRFPRTAKLRAFPPVPPRARFLLARLEAAEKKKR